VGLDLHRLDHRAVRSGDRLHPRLREGVAVSVETIVGLVLSILALAYLLYALLRPEDL